MDNNKSNKETTDTPDTPDTPEHKLCYCYSKNSHDMRACGLCYTFCYKPDEIEQCYFCPRYFKEYYESGYFITKQLGSEPECCCTVAFLPFKLPLFFPCLLGSLFNNMINYCRDTESNYLC